MKKDIKVHKDNKEKNIYSIREDIAISEFMQIPQLDKNLRYFLLKKAEFYENKITGNIIY